MERVLQTLADYSVVQPELFVLLHVPSDRSVDLGLTVEPDELGMGLDWDRKECWWVEGDADTLTKIAIHWLMQGLKS